ncbi:hypothetical protein CTEN210_05477 [Chaetoceros tenuissimus]|uniref:Uncharacterized protein n=1 Tax=Chaetoceros tenuissimus TaxID=426638 RepID=A0AAD3CN39_9STRA|nr:hypothetical protein CTEN210_05477 [Chaetoceros tenuissimus]
MSLLPKLPIFVMNVRLGASPWLNSFFTLFPVSFKETSMKMSLFSYLTLALCEPNPITSELSFWFVLLLNLPISNWKSKKNLPVGSSQSGAAVAALQAELDLLCEQHSQLSSQLLKFQSQSPAESTLARYKGNHSTATRRVPKGHVLFPINGVQHVKNTTTGYVSKYPFGYSGCFRCGDKSTGKGCWPGDKCPAYRSVSTAEFFAEFNCHIPNKKNVTGRRPDTPSDQFIDAVLNSEELKICLPSTYKEIENVARGFTEISTYDIHNGRCVGAVDGFFQSCTCPTMVESNFNPGAYYSGHYQDYGTNTGCV